MEGRAVDRALEALKRSKKGGRVRWRLEGEAIRGRTEAEGEVCPLTGALLESRNRWIDRTRAYDAGDALGLEREETRTWLRASEWSLAGRRCRAPRHAPVRALRRRMLDAVGLAEPEGGEGSVAGVQE